MLREITGERAVAALRLRACDDHDGERWRVVFDHAGGHAHELELARERLKLAVLGSCGDEAPEPASSFRLLGHRQLPAG